jgi:hypothetical protein
MKQDLPSCCTEEQRDKSGRGREQQGAQEQESADRLRVMFSRELPPPPPTHSTHTHTHTIVCFFRSFSSVLPTPQIPIQFQVD